MRTTLLHNPLVSRGAVAAVLMGALVAPAMAQSTPNVPDNGYARAYQPATRASVYADLVRLEQVGYDPDGDHVTYPTLTSAAELRAYPATGPQYRVADTSQGPTNPMPASVSVPAN